MSNYASSIRRALAFAIAATLAASPALADKPSGAREKNGRGERHESREARDAPHGNERERGSGESRERQGQSGKHAGHFDDRHRGAVRDYYDGRKKAGHCPPGLAKKHNGCMPPGQAKKWEIGRRLPPEVIFYEVPRPLVMQIGQAPSGYRYVRVAGDILMIAIGTAIVVDAIRDLGR